MFFLRKNREAAYLIGPNVVAKETKLFKVNCFVTAIIEILQRWQILTK